jgi:Asp/Glu/hydantoin racemase
MRLIIIPPYKNPAVSWGFVLHELVAKLKGKGALEGINVDVDEGYFIESPSEIRDEEFLANISIGIIKKVREYSEMGKYDAIVLTGALDPGFIPARQVSKIPVAGAIHSAVHVASLIGERFSVIHTVAPSSLIVRHCVERYGLSHKLASVRFCGHSSTEMFGLISKYKHNKKERAKVPAVKKILDDIRTQCMAAIEKDRADSLLLGCEPLQVFADDVRQKLDKAGYNEIPIICELPAGVEMAKAMVNMRLRQVPRAYPTDALEAKPEYW